MSCAFAIAATARTSWKFGRCRRLLPRIYGFPPEWPDSPVRRLKWSNTASSSGCKKQACGSVPCSHPSRWSTEMTIRSVGLGQGVCHHRRSCADDWTALPRAGSNAEPSQDACRCRGNRGNAPRRSWVLAEHGYAPQESETGSDCTALPPD